MTDASTTASKTNPPKPRGPRPDLASQLQQLRGDADAAPAEGADAASTAGSTPAAGGNARRGSRGSGSGNGRGQQQRQAQDASRQRRPQGGAQAPQQGQKAQQPERPARKVNPVLERLFERYPQLFGARFVPLKLGVYEDLLARHPEEFKADDLKVAMGQHARSTRYLESVAAGHPRHDLDGNALDPVAPEHVHHAILELHRRRSQRTGEDLRPQLVTRIARAIEASGLEREAYAVLVRSRDEKANAVVDEALAELAAQAAKREALLRAFEASGRSEQEFADMYGMKPGDVTRTLQRARKERDAQAPAPAPASSTAVEGEPESQARTLSTSTTEASADAEAQGAGEQPEASAAAPGAAASSD